MKWKPKPAIPYDAIRATARRLAVPGWLSQIEASALYGLAEEATGPIIEIGCYCGLSTAYLAAPGRQPVYSVDPHDPALYNPTQLALLAGRAAPQVAMAFWEEAGVADRIRPVVATSIEASDYGDLPSEPGLVFIDGDHRFDYVRLDLQLWCCGDYLPGAVAALHDWGERGDQPEPWGVREAAEEHMASFPEWRFSHRSGSLGILRRVP